MDRYDVHISFEADGDLRRVTDLLLQVFGERRTRTASASSIAREGNRVTVNFRELSDEQEIARALITVNAARASVGLRQHTRMSIELEPSPVHHQDELRHNHV